LDNQVQAIVTLLALINPVMCAAIFLKIEGGQPHRAQITDATKAALTVLVILTLAALVGARVLHLFGVSLDAFAVAGGMVLSWIGFTMLRDHRNVHNDTNHAAAASPMSLAPLILFAASPGTITGVITLAVAHSQLDLPVTALIAVGVAVLAMWLTIIAAIYVGNRRKGRSFFRETVTHFMGLIVIAMGVQFILTGIRSFFAATTG
jgi:MarC family membrane protein